MIRGRELIAATVIALFFYALGFLMGANIGAG